MTEVVFLLVPQLHLLDLAGPAQVFEYCRRPESACPCRGGNIRLPANSPEE